MFWGTEVAIVLVESIRNYGNFVSERSWKVEKVYGSTVAARLYVKEMNKKSQTNRRKMVIRKIL